jgi:DNA-binding winged helix-turn-helix (wHTH) protein/Tol biopolymer transport system component
MEMPQKSSWRPTMEMRIGEFTAKPASNEICVNSVTTRLRPILMDVLLRLAVESGTVVSRETLLSEVWLRRMVNDEVLSRAIAELRTALGDDPKNPRYIETLPKVGYRLIAKVTTMDGTSDLLGAAGVLTEQDHPEAPPSKTSEVGKPSSSQALESAANDADTWPVVGDHVRATRGAQLRVPIWKFLRLVLVCIVVLTAYGIYKTHRLPDFNSRQIDLERQINSAVPFATSPERESSPRFSADGKSVVFVRSSDASSEIVIQDVASGTQRTFSIPNARLASPVFFPDGKRVAYWLRRSKPDEGQPDCAIATRDLERVTDTVLVDCQHRPQPVFDLTSDGSELIYSALPRADYPLALMRRDLNAQTTQQLTVPSPGEGHDAYPRISPDNRTLAFFRGTQSHVRLWTLALSQAGTGAGDPATPRPASVYEGLSYGVAWLPRDGTHSTLIAAADWLGFRALNAVSLSEGAVRLVGARGARFPDIAKDGSIVFETATYRSDLWLTGADKPGDSAQQLWPSTRYTNQAEFSPDGKRVAFASNRSGSDSIHVADIGGDARRLPFPDDARYIQPHWSADGSEVYALQIAKSTAKSATQQAVRINLASGKVETLTHLGKQVNNAVPLSNGREIIYGEIAEHSMRLYRADLNGGTPKRLSLPAVSNFAIVENDLVYTQPQLQGATRCKLDTMVCTPINIELDDNTRFDWALGYNVIWHLGLNDERKAALVRVDLATGTRRTFDFAPSAAGTNIAVSRDGKSLLVAREAPPVVDLMIAKPIQ